MENLRNKLNSRRGASILLALLFLLVCMMVAASVLMAAVSNGGKLGSNREAQQRYLTLSSAITLVSDQLTAAQYRGRYTHTVTDVKKPVTTRHPDGTTTTEWVHDYWQHSYRREDGITWTSCLPAASRRRAWRTGRRATATTHLPPGRCRRCRSSATSP